MEYKINEDVYKSIFGDTKNETEDFLLNNKIVSNNAKSVREVQQDYLKWNNSYSDSLDSS